jgi:hypothetical protein
MKFINPETKTFKVFSALQEGKALTASQASKMGVKNLSAEVSRIRSHGFAVYTNSRKAGNGVNVTEYVLGKPSRKLVAAGYRALALGIEYLPAVRFRPDTEPKPQCNAGVFS